MDQPDPTNAAYQFLLGAARAVLPISDLVADLFTIVASGIAIYLFISKRHAISSLLKILINYAHRLTLSELTAKLERLSNLDAADPDDADEVVNIFNEIIGQIRGNRGLLPHFGGLVDTMEQLLSKRGRLTEPRKRNVVAELREKLRHLDVQSLDNLSGDRE